MPAFAERLAGRLEPWGAAGGANALLTSTTLETSPILPTSAGGGGTDLGRFVEALAAMFQPILTLAEETGEDGRPGYQPSWGVLLDPVAVPAVDLAYLGQFVGVEVPKGAPEGEARELVKREAGLERGTLKSIEDAIRKVLGAAPFTIQERTSSGGSAAAYHFNVLVGVGKSSTALKEAIEAVIPGGLFFSVIEVAGAWIAGSKKWSEVAAGKKWSAIVEGEY